MSAAGGSWAPRTVDTTQSTIATSPLTGFATPALSQELLDAGIPAGSTRTGGNDQTDIYTAPDGTWYAISKTEHYGADADGNRVLVKAGQLARGALTDTVLAGLARRRPPRDATRAQAVRQAEIRRLALAVRDTGRALKTNRAQLQAIVDELAPGLTDRRGIGAVSAAQVIISFSHPGRCRSEAAFAALAGASPLPASSGRTMRHRLNRGGDRALNRALHTIAMTRMNTCPTTQAYVARRTAQGKTPREIRRCLKRYIARELYRALTSTMTTTGASTGA